MNRTTGNMRVAFAAVLAWSAIGVCQAAPPNDDWSNRTVIGALPFTDTTPNIPQATTADTDPELFCVNDGYPTPGLNSVWYEFTTDDADQFVDIETRGYDSLLGVFEGSPGHDFPMVRGGCNDDHGSYPSKLVGLRLRANTRYSIVVSVYPDHATEAMTLTFSMKPATVYTVTKTDDTADGACDTDCSLREALVQAGTVPGAIIVPAGTYIVQEGVTATTAGAIYGAGMHDTVIEAQGHGHVLGHRSGQRLTFALHDLTLKGGKVIADENDFLASGGAFNAATGYFVLDRVALLDSTSTTKSGGGANFWHGTSASIYDSVIARNRAERQGGGIAFFGANLEIHGSAIVDNRANIGTDADGGGVYFGALFGVRLVNTTVSGNYADGDGGGVYVGPGNEGRKTTINNSSIVNNRVGVAMATPDNGGLVFDTTRPAVVTNTVISGNHAAETPAPAFDCGARAGFSLTSGYNLVQVPNGCTFAATGDLTGIDPQLLPLTTTGTIPVHEPAAGSPLIDAGDPAGGCERTDARAIARPLDGNGDGTPRCDIGAVEKVRSDVIFTDSFD